VRAEPPGNQQQRRNEHVPGQRDRCHYNRRPLWGTTVVVHPCDETSLRGAGAAAELGIIVPILVGPVAKIIAVAKQHGIDIARYELVDAPHSEAAAAKAVELIRESKGEILMKGSLHTDELMRAVTSNLEYVRPIECNSRCGSRGRFPHDPGCTPNAYAPKVALEVRLTDRILSWGSGQYYTDSIGQRAQAQARSRRRHKTSEPHLYFPKETQSVPKRKDTTRMPPNRPQWAYWDYAPHAAGRLRSD
jgi:hypothetical protein